MPWACWAGCGERRAWELEVLCASAGMNDHSWEEIPWCFVTIAMLPTWPLLNVCISCPAPLQGHRAACPPGAAVFYCVLPFPRVLQCSFCRNNVVVYPSVLQNQLLFLITFPACRCQSQALLTHQDESTLLSVIPKGKQPVAPQVRCSLSPLLPFCWRSQVKLVLP